MFYDWLPAKFLDQGTLFQILLVLVFLASEKENTLDFPAQSTFDGKLTAEVAVRPPGPNASEDGLGYCDQG